jgi:hypothetical protein
MWGSPRPKARPFSPAPLPTVGGAGRTLPHMSPAPTPAERQLADEQLAALRRLLEVGLKLAEALQADVTGAVTSVTEERAALKDADGQDVWIPLAPLPVFTGDVALAYARISRAVRLTLAMQTRVQRGLEPSRREAASPQPARSAAVPAQGDTESRERLIDRDDLAELLELTFDEAVAAIRRDLGLNATPSNMPSRSRTGNHPAALRRPIAAGRPDPEPGRAWRDHSP